MVSKIDMFPLLLPRCNGAVVAGPVAGVTQDTAITTIVIRTVAGTRENLAQYYFINPPSCDICHSPDLDQIPVTIQDYVVHIQ